MKNANRPANSVNAPDVCNLEIGLTKREYTAIRAMQALLSSTENQRELQGDARYTGNNFMEIVAKNSVEFADALLNELENKPSEP